jgi:hypothetical protein
MGLDMYLTAKYYVKNWEHTKPEERHEVTVLRNSVPVTDIPANKAIYVEIEVCTWRKANAIHQWFVDNVQDGEDDCRTTWVSREQLKELLGTVNQVLEDIIVEDGQVSYGQSWTRAEGWTDDLRPGKVIRNPEVCDDLLPTQSGFFFGGTDYDQWYIEDLEYTKTKLTEALALSSEFEFYYHASW